MSNSCKAVAALAASLMLTSRRSKRGESDPVRLTCACDASGVVVLFYKYVSVPLGDPQSIAKNILAWTASRPEEKITGKIRLAREGINASFASSNANVVEEFIAFLESVRELELVGTDYKRERACEHAFASLSVRVVEELCPFGEPDLGVENVKNVTSLSPQAWDESLRTRDETSTTVLDVRNFYESRIGHFRGATLAPIRRFSQLKDWMANEDAIKRIEGRDVFIFCTGGVRCEKVGSYLMEKLPPERRPRSVKKLEGGIVAYAREFEDGGLFQGSNYVFDARGSVPVGPTNKENLPETSRCDGCAEPSGRLSKCVGRNCHIVLIACETCGDTVYCCSLCREQTERSEGEEKFKRRACECDCFESRERRCAPPAR